MLARFIVLLLIALPAAAGEWTAIDGDSIRGPAAKNIRVFGVDTPELTGAKCASEYIAAVSAKAFTQAALDHGPVRVEAVERIDKYGRMLARVYIGQDDLAALLIRAGHGRAYHGERRRPWC